MSGVMSDVNVAVSDGIVSQLCMEEKKKTKAK